MTNIHHSLVNQNKGGKKKSKNELIKKFSQN